MPSASSHREEVLSALTTRIFNTMLDDIIMDAALQAHHEAAKRRTVCKTCNTRCNAVHTPGVGASGSSTHNDPSRAGTPSSIVEAKLNGNPNGSGHGNGTSTPTSVKGEGSLLECVVCSRLMASNRYASHLASCMGLSTARRGAVRVTKTKSATDIGRSASPSSELGNASDDGKGAKAKAKSKSKRAEDAEFNLKRKRPGSPQVSPTKSKKLKASGTPISRIRAEAEFSGHPNASKVPSKLRDTSIAPTAERSATPSSRSSSPDNALAQTPTSSAFSQSPKLTNRAVKSAASNKNRVSGTGPPKRFSPPKPAPIHDYSLDDGGDETGSSTDTDST